MLLPLAAALFCPGCAPSNEDLPATDEKAPITIDPGKAVGKIRAEMKVDQVISEMGEPQRRTSNALEYTRYGFAVMPDAEGIVRVVMCGDVTGLTGPLVKRFTGKTTAGIGMRSTRDEILAAYGPPMTEQAHPGGRISMDYPNLGLTFSLEDNKVHHIIVRLGEEYQPDAAMPVAPETTNSTKK